MFIPLAMSNEHSTLQETVNNLLDKHSDIWSVIESEAGYDEALWARIVDMGLPALSIPEEQGGEGCGPIETFVVFREMGRALLPSPLFATIGLAANVLVWAGSEEAQAMYLPRIAAGELTASLAICEERGGWSPADVSLTALGGPTGAMLHGTKHYVIDGETVDILLVVARAEDGLAVFAVDRSTKGVKLEGLDTLDPTRRHATLVLEHAPAVRVSGDGDCSGQLARALELSVLALVAEQVGGAEQVMATALEYAKLRVQFGQPIGRFQAVKHKLADMAFDVERMVSVGWAAANALASGDPEASNIVSLAKVFCSEAYFRLAADNIQIHGGIGFTWEHPAHLYFRRAKSSEFVLGSPAAHKEKLLSQLLAA